MNDRAYRFKRRILLADESRIMRRAILRILENGFDIDEVDDGIDALTRLHGESPYALLITAYDLPNLSGMGVIERLRDARETRLRTMPVVVVDSENEEHRDRVLSVGGTDFIGKPFDSRQFLDRVQALLRTSPTTTGRQRAVDAEEPEAMLDSLTGLPNGAYFEYRGKKDLSFAKRHEKDLAVVLVRMDRFDVLIKDVGRPIATQLMKKLAKYVTRAVRAEDTVCRTADHELGVIALMTDEFGAKVICDRALKKIRSTFFRYGDKELSFTVSMGLAAPRVAKINTFGELVDSARQRLRQAVEQGGNQLVTGQRLTRQVPAVGDNTAKVAALRGAVPEPFASRHVTEPVPAITDTQIAAAAAADQGPPANASKLEKAMWLLRHGQADKLAPHYLELVHEVLPLLEQAEQALDLGLREAIDRLKQRLP